MQAMIFQQMVNEDAGCISYLIGCSQAGEALVVDPGRDRVDDYSAWARRKGLSLSHIVESTSTPIISQATRRWPPRRGRAFTSTRRPRLPTRMRPSWTARR